MADQSARIETVEAKAYTIPTDQPEADGTYEWQATTIVVVTIKAAGKTGLGYTYSHGAAAVLINQLLAPIVCGHDSFEIAAIWQAMLRGMRNVGLPGLGACAISAVDNALWDLKARQLDVPLVSLLGGARYCLPVYGSGGFTSYPIPKLQEQLGQWAADGIDKIKMKVGADPAQDARRVRLARDAVGDNTHLFVDANGAYDRKTAMAQAEVFSRLGVDWFEEPVSSDDLEGLSLIRDRAPPGMSIAAGEYGYTPWYFRRLLDADSVDVVQADVTRCLGVTGFLHVASLCLAHHRPLSAHTAPAQHLHVALAALPVIHQEYFHDHARIENLLFDGVTGPVNGCLYADLTRPGNGLIFKERDAQRFAA